MTRPEILQALALSVFSEEMARAVAMSQEAKSSIEGEELIQRVSDRLRPAIARMASELTEAGSLSDRVDVAQTVRMLDSLADDASSYLVAAQVQWALLACRNAMRSLQAAVWS